MKSLTLTNRLFLVTGAALLPSFGILISSIFISIAENERNLQQQALRTAELAALEMERIISGAENVVRALSVTPIVRRGDYAVCSSLVSEMAEATPSLSAIAVINADGFTRCAPVEQTTATYLGDRDYFIESIATGERVVGTYILGRASGRKLLPVAIRIGGTEGAPLGVAVAYIDLGWLEELLQERTYTPGSSLTIADRGGTILARVPDPERFVGTVIPEDFRYLLTEPEMGTLELTSQDGTRRVVGYSPATAMPTGIYVSAGFPTEGALASTVNIALQGGLIGLAGLLAALLLAFYTSQFFVLRPVQKLLDALQAWREGKTSARTGMSATEGELGRAGHALDAFIEELLVIREASAKSEVQRQMIVGELDHRVKNLLSVVNAVARQSFSKHVSGTEMQAFSGRLHAIGEANAMLRQEDWQSASLEGLVRSAITPFIDAVSGRLTISGPGVFIQRDAVMAFSLAVHELATNASKYGALSNNKGTLSINWDVVAQPGGDQFELTWQERGGPPVVEPSGKGFGSTVLERLLSTQIDGSVELAYDQPGLVCRVSAPAGKVVVDRNDISELHSAAA